MKTRHIGGRDRRSTDADRDSQRQDRRTSEELKDALEESYELLTSVTKATDVMLVYLDPDFNFIWVNDAYARTCGFLAEEMVGRNHFRLYPHPENEAIFRRVRETGEAVFFKDKVFEFPDQPERGVTYWDWSLVPTKDRQQHVKGLVFSLRETTEFKRVELALEESEERFRLFTNNSPTCAWIKDEHGRYVYLNKAHEELGISPEDWLGRTDAECWPEHTSDQFRRNDLAVLASGKPVEVIEETHGENGCPRYWLSTKFPFEDTAGKRFIGGIALDITALEETQKDLVLAKQRADRARESAETANKAKDRFLAMVSHELRAPLSPIVHAVDLLRLTAKPDDEVRAYLDLIERNVKRESRLIDDLLDISRIISGKWRLHRESVDIAETIREAARVVKPDIDARRQRLGIELAGAPYPANADASRLVQVFWNLLSNASKFTGSGGRIDVRARVVEEKARAESTQTRVPQDGPRIEKFLLVEVIDNGGGIDPHVISELFKPFEQSDLGRQHRGLGLGLAICREVVQMHGGSISAHSEGLGHGATFSVRVPLST